MKTEKIIILITSEFIDIFKYVFKIQIRLYNKSLRWKNMDIFMSKMFKIFMKR